MNWFKKYFIPHKDNDHKPHFLRKEAMFVVLALVIVVEFVFLTQIFVIFPNTNFLSSVLPGALISLTNEARADLGASKLEESTVLDRAAELKAIDMAQNGYFSHVSPNGATPWYWFDKEGYGYSYAGENLAVNFSDSEDVVKAWLLSPAHRANIINSEFSNIGIGTAKGVYQGKEAVFVVEFFGTPAVNTATAKSKEPIAVNNEVQKESVSTTSVVVSAVVPRVLGENTVMQTVKSESSFSNILRRLSTSPRSLSALAYALIFLTVLLAVVLAFLIEIRIQYPALLRSGLAILALLLIFSFWNSSLITGSLELPSSDYAASVVQALW